MTIRPLAIIDIGSSSIRLEIRSDYRRDARIVLDEKHQCDLAEGLDQKQKLSHKAMKRALIVLERFACLLSHRGLAKDDIYILATSAVRDAQNATEFVQQVKKILPVQVHILSGQEEAHLSAMGVAFNHANAAGVVGDLGGGSLELAAINLEDGQQKISQCLSLPLGAVRFRGQVGIENRIYADLAPLELLKNTKYKTFIAVGGNWRALGLMHMARIGYPLNIIGGYCVKGSVLRAFLSEIAALSVSEIEKLSKANRKRAEMLPFAAMLLEAILRLGQFEEVEFSAMGLRNGYFYDLLPAVEQKKDGLYNICGQYLMDGYDETDAEALYRFGKPLIQQTLAVSARLHKAACLLSNIVQSDYSEMRVQHALMRILHLRTGQLSHKDRAWLAVAVASRYGRISHKMLNGQAVQQLLSQEEYQQAEIVGRTLRLGHSLSGGASSLLSDCQLYDKEGQPQLDIPKNKQYLLSNRVSRRLLQLRQSFKDMLS